ncbi:MAG: pyridoxal phosphate-dependent aminotransferase [Egibacteraceae bacterium]
MSGRTTMELASAASTMPRSGIREIMDLAWAMPDAIHLEVGEPNFPTPPHVVEAAARAAAAGHTRYTPNAGMPELRQALAEKVASRNGLVVAPEQVIVTSGAVEALYSTLLSLLDPGDQILLPDPGWPNFRMMAGLLRAEVVGYPLAPRSGYQPEIADLERLVGPRSKVLLLNTPSNPVGAVLDADHVQALLDFARAHGLWVVSDECYDEIVYDGALTSPGALDTDGRVISVYSFSKTYAMTGWRVGYAVVPEALAETLSKVQEPLISCVNAPAQVAAHVAVTGPQDVVAEMRDAYRSRRDAVVARLREAGVPAFPPGGAFYLWVDVSASGLSSRNFAHELVVRHHVAVVPGTAFGARGEGAVRLSLTTSQDLLLEGVERLTLLYAEHVS